MKTDILLTKYYPEEFLQTKFGPNFRTQSMDVITTKMVDLQLIKEQINPNSTHYIVSSARAAAHISTLHLPGIFYCVGRTSAEILEKSSQKVGFCARTATELVDFIQTNCPSGAELDFFCSSIRRDEIPDKLQKSGYLVHEIITYTTTNQVFTLDQNYDAYAFFSPSGVKSFQQQGTIPQKAVIFAIGKTTADAVFDEFGRPAEYSEESDLESLIQLIKQSFNAEK